MSRAVQAGVPVDVEQPLEPLWRGLVVYRVLTLLSAAVVVVVSLEEYAAPRGALGVLAVMVGWTALTSYGYLRGGAGWPAAARGGRDRLATEPGAGAGTGAGPGPGQAHVRRRDEWDSRRNLRDEGPTRRHAGGTSAASPRDRRGLLAVADLGVTVAVMATTPLVQTPAQIAADASVMGGFWTPGAALACALAFGLPGGFVGAAVISAALLGVSARAATELGDVQLIALAGLTIGFAATVLRRSAERVRRAVAAAAAAAERERLARAVHDGVLQVLAHVKRRGTELGGAAGELGALAGEQEITLRTLLTSGPAAPDADGRRDLAAALRMLSCARVTVAAPAHPVELPARDVDELLAAVTAALANVTLHVGPDAPAWVLLEDVGDRVQISVRDAGPGIPDGRLAQAQAQGRLGVARSLRGRVHDLGGTITLDTAPDRGTEWTILVDKRS